LQPAGPGSISLLWPETADLSYALPAHAVELHFAPNDFTQVNMPINRVMVDRALELLVPEPDDKVLDLFCGLGNFTLPLARRAREVVGVEGDAGLIRRAEDNARRNSIGNVRFHVADLSGNVGTAPWCLTRYDKILLDPPRTGALELLPQIAKLGARRIVYVSCNPATLARDAGLLMHEHGYKLLSAGVMDMFPHTAHVESIALFARKA
jgi:23S rRNA (uracil1939-C5)-methyltransferase